MDEEDQQPSQVAEARAELSKFKALIENPGFKWLFDQAQDDVQRILNGLVAIPREEITIDKVCSWVFQLGEIAAIQRHLDKPRLIIELRAAEIEQFMEEQRKEDDRHDTGDGKTEPGDTSP